MLYGSLEVPLRRCNAAGVLFNRLRSSREIRFRTKLELALRRSRSTILFRFSRQLSGCRIRLTAVCSASKPSDDRRGSRDLEHTDLLLTLFPSSTRPRARFTASEDLRYSTSSSPYPFSTPRRRSHPSQCPLPPLSFPNVRIRGLWRLAACARRVARRAREAAQAGEASGQARRSQWDRARSRPSTSGEWKQRRGVWRVDARAGRVAG